MDKLKIIKGDQKGVAHFIPLLIVVAAVGVISFLLLSSTAPFSDGLFSKLFPRKSSDAATGGFVESFAYGAPSSPMPFKSDRWQIVAGSGSVDGLKSMGPNNDQETHGFIEAGHGPHCEAPIRNSDTTLNNHILNVPMRNDSGALINPSTYPAPLGMAQSGTHVDSDLYQQQIVPNLVYICNNHMMTTMEAGYDIVTFMPRYQLDWSGGRTQTIQWDTNVYGLGRAWYDVYIIPNAQMPMWVVENNAGAGPNLGIPVNQGGPVDTTPRDALILSYNNGAFRPEQWSNWQYLDGPGAPQYCGQLNPSDPACGDPSLRRTFRVTFNSNTITMQIQNQNGVFMTTYSGNLRAPLPYTSAMARFSHHTYNASKDIAHIGGASQTVFDAALGGNITANPLAWGQPYSLYTYHWANVSFDGPANPDHQAYVASPNYLDLNGAGSTKTVHVNVTNSDIRTPMIWALANTVMQDQAGDPYNRTGWLRYRVNGGAWQSFHNIRDGGPFVNGNGNDEIDQATWNGPLSGLHLGDNAIDINFDHMPSGLPWEGGYQNVHLYPIEVQVAPTSDMPPANPGGVVITPGPSVSSAPTPTPVPTPTRTPTPTPTPAASSTPIPAGQFNIFGTQTPPLGTDTNPYELGVKFRTSVSGTVSGVRFYKGPNNTGTHTGSLWNSAGTRLATATFTGESASGWQQVNFSPAVTISANTTYVASYHTNTGFYAQTQNGFATAVTSGPLTALANGTDGGNGVYSPGATSSFPNQTFNASNYWVDVVFNSGTVTPTPVPTPTPTPTPTPIPTPTRTPTPTATPSCPKGPIGDTNCDGAIDIFDYSAVVTHFNQTGTNIAGDINRDGVVDIFDYSLVVTHFGQ